MSEEIAERQIKLDLNILADGLDSLYEMARRAQGTAEEHAAAAAKYKAIIDMFNGVPAETNNSAD